MNHLYVMNPDGTVLPEPDVLKWGAAFSNPGRILGTDNINGVRVSTVFLGVDHSFFDGVPILFETMIFGGRHDQYQERYATRDEAMDGHRRAVILVQETP